MKPMILLLLTVPLMLSCAHLRESDEVDPSIHGTWAGEGRFYDRDLKAEYGTVALTLEIHPDNSVRGSMGGATLVEGVIKSRPGDFLIEGALTGQVFDAGSFPEEEKDNLVIILKPPESETTTGDFHLKTNLAFDFSMRAGAVTLSRTAS